MNDLERQRVLFGISAVMAVLILAHLMSVLHGG